MTYKVILIRHDEGYTVKVPELKGCISEGNTEAEALENIKDAIESWLAYHQEEGKELDDWGIREVKVTEVEVHTPALS